MAYYTPLYTSYIWFLKYLKQYKLTFVFLKLTLHIGTCKAALSVHVECVLTAECLSSTSLKDRDITKFTQPTEYMEHEGQLLLFFIIKWMFNSENFQKKCWNEVKDRIFLVYKVIFWHLSEHLWLSSTQESCIYAVLVWISLKFAFTCLSQR